MYGYIVYQFRSISPLQAVRAERASPSISKSVVWDIHANSEPFYSERDSCLKILRIMINTAYPDETSLHELAHLDIPR